MIERSGKMPFTLFAVGSKKDFGKVLWFYVFKHSERVPADAKRLKAKIASRRFLLKGV
jgi:hypothetical protein